MSEKNNNDFSVTPRCKKHQAIKLVTQNTAKYVELFLEFKAFDGGWIRWPDKFIQLRKKLNIDNYVILYNNEKHINNAYALFEHGEEGLKEWNQSLLELTPDEQQRYMEDYAEELLQIDPEELEASLPDIPDTPEEIAAAQKIFNAFSEEEQKLCHKQTAFLFLFIFSSMHNYLSLMVMGEKLTSLVPKAINCDDTAFLKAIQIDRHILKAHPYFVQRYATAVEKGEDQFLKDISYRLTNPNLRGKIRYPGLYVAFAILESVGWLDALTHSEILDVCTDAGLDRFQNRIEDVNYLTKRLAGYRRYQKTSGVSMHSN